MSSTLSPLALANRAKLEKHLNLIDEGIRALRSDLTKPEGQTEEALTGNTYVVVLGMLFQAHILWQRNLEKLIAETPEYLAWDAENPEDPDLKPGLND